MLYYFEKLNRHGLGLLAYFIPFAALISPRTMGTVFPCLVLLTAVYGFKHLSRKEILSLFLPAILVSILAVLSLIWTVSWNDSMERIGKTLPLLFALSCLPLSFGFYNEKSANYLNLEPLKYLLGGAAVIISIDIFLGGPLSMLIHDQTADFNSSVYNRSLILLLLTAIPVLIKDEALTSISSLFLITTLFLACLITQSQSFQLGCLLVLLLYFLTKLTKRSFILPYAFVFTGIILVMPWLMPFLYTLDPVILEKYIGQGYPLERLEIWKLVSGHIQDTLFMGHGIETIKATDFGNQTKYLQGTALLHSHNIFLQIWFEFGLLGITLFLILFWSGIMKTKKLDFAGRRLMIMLLVPLSLICAISYGIWQAWFVGTLSFSLVFAYRLVSQRDNRT